MKRRGIVLLTLLLLTAACNSVVPVAIQPVQVKGNAMLPALNDGDRIVIERNPQKLERGDIVVFLFPQDQTMSYIKRIVGLPNEVVEIREGTIFINGTRLDEPYVDSKNNITARSLMPLELAAGNYFVIGDNRDNSSDSRIWGPVKRELIYGKYLKKYYDAGP